MIDTTTIARRANPVAIAAGIATGLIAGTVLAGYAAANPALVRLFPWSAPMRLPLAAGLLLCALAVLSLALGWKRIAAAFSAAAGLTGIELLRQAAFGALVTGFEVAAFTAKVSGSVTLLAGACLTVAAAALFLMTGIVRIRRRLAVVGVLGSIIASIGGVAVLSYAAGMSAAFADGHFTLLGVHTAFCLALLGAAMIRFAWADSVTGDRGAPSWLPALVAFAVLTVTACLWEASAVERAAELRHTIDFDTQLLKNDLELQVDNRIQPLVRLARTRAAVADLTKQDWDSDVHSILTRGGYQSIQWVDPSLRAVWVTPPGAGDVLQDGSAAFESRRKAAFDRARANRTLALTAPVDLVTGGKGMLVCVPVFVDDELRGFVTGVFRYHLLLKAALTSGISSRYSVALFDGAEEIYSQGVDRAGSETRVVPLHVGQAAWKMQVSPGEGLLSEARSAVAGALPVAGCVLALVFALLVRLMMAAPQARLAAIISGHGSQEPAASALALMPVLTYGREGASQMWNAAAEELFDQPPPPVTPAAEPFQAVNIAIVRASAAGRQLASLLDSCAIPVLAFDADGAFSSANTAAAHTLGWTAGLWRDRRVRASTDPIHIDFVLLLQGQSTTGGVAESGRVLAGLSA